MANVPNGVKILPLENFNRLSRAHERYRRQTDGRRHNSEREREREREREFTFTKKHIGDECATFSLFWRIETSWCRNVNRGILLFLFTNLNYSYGISRHM